MLKEFRDFILRGNVIDLAVGIVIGAAFGALVTSFVTDILTPLLGVLNLGQVSELSFQAGYRAITGGLTGHFRNRSQESHPDRRC